METKSYFSINLKVEEIIIQLLVKTRSIYLSKMKKTIIIYFNNMYIPTRHRPF